MLASTFLLYPHCDSNAGLRLRRATLYPLSYGGSWDILSDPSQQGKVAVHDLSFLDQSACGVQVISIVITSTVIVFAAIPVAADTIFKIGYTFVLILDLILVVLMTAIAGVGVVIVTRVTAGTGAASASVVEWEGMVEIGRQPSGCVVANRTLTGEVIGWLVRQVAALTVDSPGYGMVECGR